MTRKELVEQLETIMCPEYIDDWIDNPNPAFDGKKPSELLDTEKECDIISMLYYLQSGSLG